MFSKILALATLLAAATATPTPGGYPPPSSGPQNSCSTGPVKCCQSVVPATSPAVAGILGLLGIIVQDVNALVGLQCSPVTVIGVGSGNTCSSTAVCCQDNSHGNFISLGCTQVVL